MTFETAPEGFQIARSARAAMEFLLRGDVTHISLDYDLGLKAILDLEREGIVPAVNMEDEPNGLMVMLFMRQFRDWMFPMPKVTFHTANPEGLKKMQAVLRDIERGYR